MKKTTALTLIADLAGAVPAATMAQQMQQQPLQQQPQQQPQTTMQAITGNAPSVPGAVQDPAIAEQA